MRAKIIRQSTKVSRSLVRVLVDMAGRFFPEVTGEVRVLISDSRRPGRFWGNACGRAVRVCLPPAATSVFPIKLQHGYRRFRAEDTSLREGTDTVEVLVWLLGHEMGHVTRHNRRLRRGSQERHSDRCAAELLDLFRQQREQLESDARCLDDAERTHAAALAASEPQRRLDLLMNSRGRWQTRLTRAKNKLRKLDRQIAEQRRKMGVPLPD